MREVSEERGLTLITYYQSESTELSSLSTPVSVRDLLSTKNSESAVWYTFWQINEQFLQRNHVKKFTISPILYKLFSCLGDLDGSDPDHVVCVDNVLDFTTAFLFSVETQHTIGWLSLDFQTGWWQIFRVRVPGKHQPVLGHCRSPVHTVHRWGDYTGRWESLEIRNDTKPKNGERWHLAWTFHIGTGLAVHLVLRPHSVALAP